MRYIIFSTVVLVLGFVALSAAALARSGSDPATSFDKVSNAGRAVGSSQTSASDRSALASTGAVEPLLLLGSRSGTAFYRLAGKSGRSCYALGADIEPRGLGYIACPDEGFPTEEVPILDQSALSVDPEAHVAHVIALRGIAADGVARVGVLDTAGRLHATPVSENIYLLADIPAGSDSAIVAFDDDGNQVFDMRLTELGR